MSKNKVEEAVKKYFEQGDIKAALKALEKMNVEKLSEEEQKTWYYNHAVLPLWIGDRETAYKRLREASEKYPDSQKIRFSLGQEYEYHAEKEKMTECFSHTSFPHISAGEVRMESTYFYSWDDIENAYNTERQLIQYYMQLGILDTQFVSMRGFPFFEEVFHDLTALALLKKDFHDTDVVLSQAVENCTDFDKESLKLEYELIKKGDDDGRYKKLYRKDKLNFYSEQYLDLKLAVYEAKQKKTYEEAMKRIERVHANPDKVHSVYDLQLLTKGNIALKFDNEKEPEFRKEFLDRVMALFGPGICLDFSVLEYQETLKQEYQNRRRKKDKN